MVSLRQHGVPVVQSPYKSMAPLLKHQKQDDIDDTDGGGFSVSEVRSVRNLRSLPARMTNCGFAFFIPSVAFSSS